MTPNGFDAAARPGDAVYRQLVAEVIRPGLCTHCGLCVGLSRGTLTMQERAAGPQPVPAGDGPIHLPETAYLACPGKGIAYPELNCFVFGSEPDNWLIGHHRGLYIGHATEAAVRRSGASGGVITQTLLYLLARGEIDGAVVLRQGWPRPWEATPIIATTADEIRAAAQSVYAPIPVLTVLDELARFPGKVALVGLPDQIAAVRQLQALGEPAAQKIVYLLGPYTGTNLYGEAIASYLRAQGVHDMHQVAEVRHREGEWPGNLYVRLHDGREFRAAKFYYNYLIPFYVTRATLYAVDFANELTDISVGDAWHPRYESQGGGHSVVVARTEAGQRIVDAMIADGVVSLTPTTRQETLAMHGHMLDFKKRGSFIRLQWRAWLGLPIPDYGYHPASIPLGRYAVECVISTIFAVGRMALARRIIEQIPLSILGPLFNTLRLRWKALSKPTKRRGLGEVDFVTTPKANPADDAVTPSWPARLRAIVSLTRQEIAHWRRRSWTFADVGAHWDSTEDYDDINEETYSYFRRFTDGYRLSNLQPQGRVLDLCARTGNGTLYFYQQGKVASAVCADVSARMGEICRERLAEGGFEQVVWVPLDDYSLPLADASFDSVLCFETVEHFSTPEGLVAELGRVTRPGGQMILTTPNVLWEPVHALAAITGLHHSEGPHRFVTRSRLRRMVLAAGFTIETEATTVLVPGGPDWLVRLGEWIEARTQHSLMPYVGLRRILICRRRA